MSHERLKNINWNLMLTCTVKLTLNLYFMKYSETVYTSFKVRLSHSKKNCVFYLIDEMMKNAFYFILKALFVLKIFKFLS